MPQYSGTTMNTGSMRPELFMPGLYQVFDTNMQAIESRISQAFHVATSDQMYEEMLGMSGIGLFNQRLEGQPIQYQGIASRYKSRFTHLDYSNGIRYTKRLKRELKYIQSMKMGAAQFGQSAAMSRELLAVNFLARGFYDVWNAEEGLAFFHAAHPLDRRSIGATTYGNLIEEDISYDAIQRAIVLLENTPNPMGYPQTMTAKFLYYHPEREFLINEIFGSPGRHDTANNTKNTLAGRIVPVPWKVIPSTSMWFLQGSTFHTYWFDREALMQDTDEDFDTGDTKHKAEYACSCGAADWQGWVGCLG